MQQLQHTINIRGGCLVSVDAELFRSSLRRLASHIGRVEASCLECCGVSMAQCHVLVEVARAGQLTLSSLAAALNLDLSSVSRGVEALVRDGYLLRERHPNDRRYILISLGPRGQEAYGRVEASGLDLAARIVDQIPATRWGEIVECMELLSTAIQKCCSSVSCAPDY